MRKTIVSAALATLLAASPAFAKKDDQQPKHPDGGQQQTKHEDNDRHESKHETKQDGGDNSEIDLSPWIQRFAREGLHGHALTERLEQLLKWAHGGENKPNASQSNNDGQNRRAPGGGMARGGPRGFGGPGGGGPGFGGPGGNGGPGQFGPGNRGGGFRNFGGRGPGFMPQQPQAHADGKKPELKNDEPKKPEAKPAPKGPGNDGQTEALREIQKELHSLHENMAKLEKRLDNLPQPNKGPSNNDGGDRRGPGPRGGRGPVDSEDAN